MNIWRRNRCPMRPRGGTRCRRRQEFAEAMGDAGIWERDACGRVRRCGGGKRGAVVVAAALFWTRAKVSLLDGGIIQWIAEGRPLSSREPTFARATFHGQANPNMVVTKEQMIALTRDKRALILDARAPERYEGKTEPIDRAGGAYSGGEKCAGVGKT